MNFNKFTKAELISFIESHGVELPRKSSRSKSELVEIADLIMKDIQDLPDPVDAPELKTIDYIYRCNVSGMEMTLAHRRMDKTGTDYWIGTDEMTGMQMAVSVQEMQHLLQVGSIKPLKPEPVATKSKACKEFNPDLINTNIDPEKMVKMLTTAIKKGEEKCITLLFHGVPGTGKTEVSKYIGDQLGLKVVRKNLSDILGKYVGDTEKALAESFKEARNNILHIDEFDSLANDREDSDRQHEVSRTNAFLQSIDDFEGILVVTTNSTDRVDNAIMRRFLLKMEFKNLSQEQTNAASKHFFPKYKLKLGSGRFAPADFALVKRSLIFVEDDEITKEFLEARIKEESAYRMGVDPESTSPISFLKGNK